MASPLFILAAPRSYTSLLCGMIGQHPETYGLPEVNLFLIDELRDFWEVNPGKLAFTNNRRHGLLRTVAELYAGEQTIDTIEMATHWCAARESESGSNIFKEIVEKLDPLVAVDKSPVYCLEKKFLQRIIETFPDARFLHLVRHPISQGASVMNLYDGAFAVTANSIDYTETEAILDPQLAWHDINLNILEFLSEIPNSHQKRIQGEAIMSRPELYLKEIIEWLGLRNDDQAINEMLHPERSPYACLGPLNAMYGNDPNFLRGSSFKRHTPITPSLDGNLFWRDDGKNLYPQTKQLAKSFGY